MSAVVDPATLTGASGAAVGADGTVSGGASTTAHQYSGSWNLYREVADILHIVGTLILILVILKNGHCKGISYKTQLCWMLVFVSRYLDLSSNMTNYQSSRDWHVLYLVLFKITYIGCQAVILFCFYHFNKTSPGSVYEAHKDTFNLYFVLAPCIVLSCLTPNYWSAMEILWTFSHYLEGFTMVPQYVFIYRHNRKELRKERAVGVDYYIFCVGAYKTLYACNWLYKYWIGRFFILLA